MACTMRPPRAYLAQKAAAGFPHCPRPQGPAVGPRLGGGPPGPWMPGVGTWEPEAADLRARVLTNGFETCLPRPRDQPLAEGKFPSWLSVF